MDAYNRGELRFELTDAGPADGEPVVLLHGFPQNRTCWAGVIPSLAAAGYRVLAPDQRGYSPSARPTGRSAYRIAELVDDVIALLDAADLPAVHLVGHDWGAFVAWALASRHPDRLRTLTALSVPHPAAFAYALPRGQALRSWYMLAFQLPRAPEMLLRSRLGRSMVARTGLTEGDLRANLDRLGPDGITAALNWYRAVRPDPADGHRITVPTMYVWSDCDTALGRVGAEATRRFVTGPYRFEVLRGVSHWIPEQAADQLATLVLDHLGEHRADE